MLKYNQLLSESVASFDLYKKSWIQCVRQQIHQMCIKVHFCIAVFARCCFTGHGAIVYVFAAVMRDQIISIHKRSTSVPCSCAAYSAIEIEFEFETMVAIFCRPTDSRLWQQAHEQGSKKGEYFIIKPQASCASRCASAGHHCSPSHARTNPQDSSTRDRPSPAE